MTFAQGYVLALTLLALYVLGISLMTTQVSYPLYKAVPTDAFAVYHRTYNRRIPLVIVLPAFTFFIGCSLLPVARPDAVPLRLGLVCGAGGLAALVTTLAWAIPSHLRLQRDGFIEAAYQRLLSADRVRTGGVTVATVALVWATLLTFRPR